MKPIPRLGDLCSGHDCFPPRPSITASPNVFINGKAVCRVGDRWDFHSCSGHTPHDGVLITGSTKVFANGKAIGRVGDRISCGSIVATGSPNVYVSD